jgi:hypothetical protein
MITQRITRVTLVWLVVLAAVFGVVASCASEEGLYQGPGDSEPHWRR